MNPLAKWLPGLLLSTISLSAAQAQEVRVRTSEELAEALRGAEAGTTILIEPGTYRGGLSAGGLKGTEERPIVIAAADAKDPPVIEGGGSGLHLQSPQHVELRGLVLRAARGNGLNVDDSGDVENPARHVVLKNLAISDIGPRGNCDGIKLSGLRDFRIEGCRVERWGSSG
jgi:hypothetical protein